MPNPRPLPRKPAPKPPRKPAPAARRGPQVRYGFPAPYGRNPPKPSAENQQWAEFLNAESIQESGGNWGAVSPDNALGRWQVLASNLPGWANQCGLPVVSPDYFLSNHAYQTELVTCILKPQFENHGPASAAAWWYSGQYDATATFGNPPVYSYVDSVLHLMGAGLPLGLTGHGAQANYYGLPGIPPVGNDSWAETITGAGNRFRNIGSTLNTHAGNINSLLHAREEH